MLTGRGFPLASIRAFSGNHPTKTSVGLKATLLRYGKKPALGQGVADASSNACYFKGTAMKSLTPNQTKLGFIGLGNMGNRITTPARPRIPSVRIRQESRYSENDHYAGWHRGEEHSGTGEHRRCGSLLPDQR